MVIVSNNAGVGINNFNMHSTNNAPNFRTNWNLSLLVYPAAGKQLYINILPLPLKVTHYNLLPSQVYMGQHFVNALKFTFTNQNQFYDNDIYYIKVKTLDTNLNNIAKIKKIRWLLNSFVGANDSGFLKFKVLIK